MRFFYSLAIATLLAPGCLPAASREMQELQRDVAQLQSQLQSLQSSFDTKMASLQTLVQQALDSANKANTSVNVLSASVTQSVDRELRERLTPVVGVTAKMDNLANDSAELRNSVSDLTTQVNKIQQQLSDISNALKVIQSPAAAPPPPNTNVGPSALSSPGGSDSAGTPPAPAATLYGNASRDMQGGKPELAASEFADFVRFYPNDPMAPYAQFYIGQIHYQQRQYEQAARDFDAVVERFSENKMTPDAIYMKGVALVRAGRRDAAIKEFRTLIAKYPRSEHVNDAKAQLRAMGVSTTGTTTTTRRTP